MTYSRLRATERGLVRPPADPNEIRSPNHPPIDDAASGVRPQLGRFTQSDPFGQEPNPYLYAGGDPVNSSDPTGLFSIEHGFTSQ